VRRPHRHSHIVPRLGVDVFSVIVAGGEEADGALRDEEGLIVHFVPVRWGTVGVRRDDDFGGAEAVVYYYVSGCAEDMTITLLLACMRSIFHNANSHDAELVDFASFGGHKIDVDLGGGQVCWGIFLGCHVVGIFYAV